uniref:Ig-like domain-containing protein n=1 Tax=Flagellimonas chongwuensis TaxID=2697365 RepID=A0A850NLA8_9FLAO|nr:RHS repeat-associated core domain-containing protein [Allomuricauda chongwuensis]NVN18057.1 hypothetical protein [Allomuricauda chongwuensis]
MKLKSILTILLLGGLVWANAQVTPEEKQALQDLYNATNGPTWISETDVFLGDDWNFAGNVTSDWHGVTVANGHVTELNLESNELEGNIPASIGDLVHLTLLNVFKNELTGNIPNEIGNLTSLETLNLSNNGLIGEIPSSLANSTGLISLNLTGNDFSGAIPSEIIDQTSLKNLQIGNNRFHFGDLEYTYQNFEGNTFTYAPQQKTDQPEAHQIIEGGDVDMSTAIAGTQNHYQWFKDGQPINGAPDSPNFTIVNAALEDAGTYHCEMTSDIVDGLVLARHNIELTIEAIVSGEHPDEDWNMITVWEYDLDNNLKGNSRRYYDDLGKHVQTQSWDAVTKAIWGQATLYDFQGRPALSSLSAPLTEQNVFQYHEAFITNEGGTVYGAPDFDVNPYDPDTVFADGPLGEYYTGITSDQYQDVTNYPFLRTIFSELNPGAALAAVGGNKVDTNGDDEITPTDEWPQAYSFTMPATDELSLQAAFGEEKYKDIRTLKTVARDVHGNESVVFSDTDGKLLAAARSGENGGLSPQMQLAIGAQGYVDVHIPKGDTGISVSNIGAVTLYNLITDAEEPVPANSLPPGFYRVAVNDLENYEPNSISVGYRVNYYDYSLNEYDEAGRLVAAYQPITDKEGNKLVTTYQYNTLGQLVSTTSPDEGTAGFKYRKDGQIRYSQNSKQALDQQVSYTDYDPFGRPVESGVLTKTDFSPLDPDALLPNASKKEVMRTVYDFLGTADYDFLADLPSDYQRPSFLAGNVARTSNDQSTTYYSYDGYGRVKWLVQDMAGLGAKTIDYVYAPLTGQVAQVIYQKGEDDQFTHKYTYNNRNQLQLVETSGDGENFELNARYFYNEAGTLVRTELAGGAQGLDYVYNLAGQLKSINHPSLASVNDPGNDANDLFGMQLDYHLGDYQRTENGNITTTPQGSDQFNGNIKGIRWKTNVDQLQAGHYVYSYDRNNWLTGADFDPGNNSTAYDVGPITYDANGNIQTLVRNKDPNGQNSTAMDKLDYNYDPGTPNRLLYVEDGVGAIADADDMGSQDPGNYEYNNIGQLTRDNSQNIDYIYNTSGLVAEVARNGKPMVKFLYNDRNQRAKKETYGNGILIYTTYYVRDVAGQVMAVYNNVGGDPALAEQPVYGAGRVGVAYNGNNNAKMYVYQLTDHLGNVRAVFMKEGNEASLEGYTDYYPFGMPMPNRTLLSADGYRYAFQGQEKDPETGKEAFQLRLWDGRIGRWLTTDPYGQYASPYLGMGNDPINGIDPDGGWKSRVGAWLWKTFNGGGEIVGEKGNWSVAQQGADGWDTFVTNGDFAGKANQYMNLNYTPLPGATIGAEDMKGADIGVGVTIESALPIRSPITGNYGDGFSFGLTPSSEGYQSYYTRKVANESGLAFGISVDFFGFNNQINEPLTPTRLGGYGSEVSGSVLLLGASVATDGIYLQQLNGHRIHQKPTYQSYGLSVGPGIDIGYTQWDTYTFISGK